MVMADSVTEVLRSDILDGVFMPGERLIEVPLSERYDIGRAAIREALVQLESEGLVDRQANRGAVVRRVSIAEAIEITEARSALESLITARAARLATDEDKVSLREVIADMRDAVERDDPAAYSSLNLQLHKKLRDMSRHEVANEMVENLRNRAVQNQYRLALMPGRREVSLEQHAAIVDAVVEGDEVGAAAAMTAHLSSVIDVLGQWGDRL
jgi:DNA-binding GntR family transcriptional regulator